MAKIKQIHAREILDSRGNPTIETTVILSDNSYAAASVPSGASVSSYEAMEMRDHDEHRFYGMGVLKAVENVNQLIAPKLVGKDATNQPDIDKTMIEADGTQNKGVLGANAILSVSCAVAKAAAKSSVLPLFVYLRQFIKNEVPLHIPTPIFNVLNGGKHAGGNIDFQEFILVPATSIPYSNALAMCASIYKSLKRILEQNNLTTLLGDEGGFGPQLSTNVEGFSYLKQAVALSNLRFGFEVFFGLDAASTTFYKDHHYQIKDKAMSYSSSELISLYEELIKEYNLIYLEDGLSEDDWEGWVELAQKLKGTTLVVGDDLTSTNPYRLQMAISKQAVNGVIIKPNQIGTVIEALAVVEVARLAGLKTIVSHRSGETNDDFIADFAVAVGADYVKFGAPARGERVAKYNRLLQIEKQLQAL